MEGVSTKKYRFLLKLALIEIALIVCIGLATKFNGLTFYLFYNLLYGLILSTVLPIILIFKEREGFSSVGIKKFRLRQIAVVALFIIFSIGGQVVPKLINGETIRYNLLPICVIPLIMTTFFEEFLFRGYMQTRIEKIYGFLPAIVLSGLMFSLYHLGYPGFRTINDLLLLFAVGIGFAVAFKLSDNNLIASYFVNLPNAFLTYILKSEQFPIFTKDSTLFRMYYHNYYNHNTYFFTQKNVDPHKSFLE